jgi:hypothetical protein
VPLAEWLGEWSATVIQHHERFDGTGYPYGLKGEDISLGGRIVAVADSYETMTAVRSYKAAMTPESARTELAACAGAHFDPAIVRVFLEASIGRIRLLGGPLASLGDISPNGFPPYRTSRGNRRRRLRRFACRGRDCHCIRRRDPPLSGPTGATCRKKWFRYHVGNAPDTNHPQYGEPIGRRWQ